LTFFLVFSLSFCFFSTAFRLHPPEPLLSLGCFLHDCFSPSPLSLGSFFHSDPSASQSSDINVHLCAQLPPPFAVCGLTVPFHSQTGTLFFHLVFAQRKLLDSTHSFFLYFVIYSGAFRLVFYIFCTFPHRSHVLLTSSPPPLFLSLLSASDSD